MDANDIHLVRVTPDDRSLQFWGAATSREQAVDLVLQSVPEGWSACLVDASLMPMADAPSGLAPGEARRLDDEHGRRLQERFPQTTAAARHETP